MSSSASGDQITGDSFSAMSRILPTKEILDIPSTASALIQRTDTFVYFRTKRIQLFDM